MSGYTGPIGDGYGWQPCPKCGRDAFISYNGMKCNHCGYNTFPNITTSDRSTGSNRVNLPLIIDTPEQYGRIVTGEQSVLEDLVHIVARIAIKYHADTDCSDIFDMIDACRKKLNMEGEE
jgi:hypothetical protein